MLNAASAPLSVLPAPRDSQAADFGSYWASVLLRVLLSWLVVRILFGKPRAAQIDSKQGNKSTERCLVVVFWREFGLWFL